MAATGFRSRAWQRSSPQCPNAGCAWPGSGIASLASRASSGGRGTASRPRSSGGARRRASRRAPPQPCRRACRGAFGPARCCRSSWIDGRRVVTRPATRPERQRLAGADRAPGEEQVLARALGSGGTAAPRPRARSIAEPFPADLNWCVRRGENLGCRLAPAEPSLGTARAPRPGSAPGTPDHARSARSDASIAAQKPARCSRRSHRREVRPSASRITAAQAPNAARRAPNVTRRSSRRRRCSPCRAAQAQQRAVVLDPGLETSNSQKASVNRVWADLCRAAA